jgi:hypothetical protein
MEVIDEHKLDTDSLYRLKYVSNFIGFDESDVQVLRENIDLLVDSAELVYTTVMTSVLKYDVTKKFLLARFHGYDGPLVNDLDEVTIDSDIVVARINRYRQHVLQIKAATWNEEFVMAVIKNVGNGSAWGNEQLDIDPVHNHCTGAIMRDEYTKVVLTSDLDADTKIRLVLALSKIFSMLGELRLRKIKTT